MISENFHSIPLSSLILWSFEIFRIHWLFLRRFSNFHRPIISYDIFRRHRMPLSYHNPGGAPKKVKPNEVFYQTFFNKHLQIRKKSIKWVRGNHWPDVIITVSLKKSRSIVRSEKIENMEFGKTLRPLVSICNDFSVFQT